MLKKANGELVHTGKMLPGLLLKQSNIARSGRGVFARELIAPDQEVSLYGGELIALCEAEARREQVIMK